MTVQTLQCCKRFLFQINVLVLYFFLELSMLEPGKKLITISTKKYFASVFNIDNNHTCFLSIKSTY